MPSIRSALARGLTALLASLVLAACQAGSTTDPSTPGNPPPTDSIPTPGDTIPVPPDTASVPPARGNPHEPAGFVRIAEHDFTTPIQASWKGVAGQAGCWERNGGGAMTGGKYVVTYPVGFADGRTPATLHAMSTCQSPRGYDEVYIHMVGFVPGDGTPFWNNGEGDKLLFWHFGTGAGSPILKCWDYVAGSAGGVRPDCELNLYAQGTWLGARTARIRAGRGNDIECVLRLNTPGQADGSVDCWINGVAASWNNVVLRTQAASQVSEFWLDWTYGGGGAGVAVGLKSVLSLSGFYASGR